MHYVRLLRLQDQYLQISSVLAAGLLIGRLDRILLLWIGATTCFSAVAFMINELVDRTDTNCWSWNTMHISRDAHLHPVILWFMGVLFALVGMWLSWSVQLFPWGLAILTIGIAYSAPPVRLKARSVVDIASQSLVWWVFPFSAPLAQLGAWIQTVPFVVTMMLLSWSIFYPYQLADFRADKASGLRSTHVVLGLRKSLLLGFGLGIIGLVFWVFGGYWRYQPWTVGLVFLEIFVCFEYQQWLAVKKEDAVLPMLQSYVRRMRPWTQLLVPYLLFWFVQGEFAA